MFKPTNTFLQYFIPLHNLLLTRVLKVLEYYYDLPSVLSINQIVGFSMSCRHLEPRIALQVHLSRIMAVLHILQLAPAFRD